MRRKEQREQALYVISVAAELAGVHPQTLRVYERKGLLSPRRTTGNTRRYSEKDIEQLREIQRLTQDEGVNLAGTAMIMHLREQLEDALERIDDLEADLAAARRTLVETVEAVHRSYRKDIVLYSPPAALMRRER